MAILRRYQHVFKHVGCVASVALLAKKQYYMLSGDIENDLSRVTTAKIGSLKDPYYSVPELLRRLRRYKASMYCRVLCLRDSNLIARLSVAIDNLETDVSDGALRKQPFCVMLYGYPGTGKSSFAIQIAKTLMTDLYGEFKTSDMVTLNETDEYQSEFRTSHKVVLFDDIGASKYGLNDTKNPWRKVIDFVNNIKKTALNPNVEMKGKVYIEPDLVILTSNLDFAQGGLINGYIPAYEAILRRLSRIVKVQSHTMVRPLEPHGPKLEASRGTYLTRECAYQPRGGFEHPTDVLREDYIEELRAAFREHNLDQEKFLDKFNSYFDDYPGHPNLTDEILQSQSGNPDVVQLNERYEAEIQYYVTHVNWERFFIEWYQVPSSDYRNYYLSPEGIIKHEYSNYKDLLVSLPLLELAYERIRPKTSVSTPIRAESKSLKDKLSAGNGDSRSDQLQDKLIQHCRDMKSKWRKLNELELHEVLPSVYHEYLKMTKAGTRPTQKSYYKAYAMYICVDLNITAYRLFAESIFLTEIPPKYALRRSKIAATIQNRVDKLRFDHPYLFDNPGGESCDPSELDYSVSEVSEITEVIPDEKPPSSSSIATSSATPWIDEADQVKYLLSTVKCSQPCRKLVNTKLHDFGEIDLLFIAPRSILVFELKSGLSLFTKAKQQALKYSRVMSALCPGKRVIGLTHTPIGFNMVCDLNASVTTEFEGFLRMIGYLDATIVVEG